MAAERKKQPSDSYVNQQKKVDFSLVKRLLKIADYDRDNLIFQIITETGCTSKDLVNIKYSDIQFEKRTIEFDSEEAKKGKKKNRIVSISKGLTILLKKFADPNRTFIFYSKKSPKLRTRSVRKIFDKYSQFLGAKITSSDLRNAYIFNAFKKSIPTETIKQSIGIKRLEYKKFLTINDFRKLETHANNTRDKLILNILFETGCKVSELVQIKVGEIEFTTNSLTISATRQKRISTISSNLSLQLKSFVNKNNLTKQDFLLSTRQSQSISEKRVFQLIQDIAKDADIGYVNPQVLRYTYIAHSFAINKSIEEVSKNTGIRNLSKLHLYGSLTAKGGYNSNND